MLGISRFSISSLARFYRIVHEFFRAVGRFLRLPRHSLPLFNGSIDPFLRFLTQ
jgi:hypothetical protein